MNRSQRGYCGYKAHPIVGMEALSLATRLRFEVLADFGPQNCLEPSRHYELSLSTKMSWIRKARRRSYELFFHRLYRIASEFKDSWRKRGISV
jgi:hypothetical protein